MALRSVVSGTGLRRSMEGAAPRLGSSGIRYFSDSKGRILSEEERAAENIYVQKMERERMEKLKLQAEKEKAEKEKGEKKTEEPNKS